MIEEHVKTGEAESDQDEREGEFSGHVSLLVSGGLNPRAEDCITPLYTTKGIWGRQGAISGFRQQEKGMALTPKHFGLQSGPMIHFGDIASALVAPDPVDHVGRVMGRLMEHIAAKAGAVVAPDEDGDTRVIAARNVSLESIEAIASLWRRSVKALEAGRICGREGQRLIPLIDDGKLVGAVYIESSQAIPDLGAYGTILARAVRVAIDPFASAEVGADLLGIGAEESKREITLATLRQHEWNISRVARELGLTRRTIYLRLARWGVTREKVSKTPRRLAVEEA